MISDGAITAGMAFEAMNHARRAPDMLVILNDNEMSISENVGALNNHLAHLLSGKLTQHCVKVEKSFLTCRLLKSY